MTRNPEIIRIAEVPAGRSSVFVHPACTGSRTDVIALHDLSIAELLQRHIIYCADCCERIVPAGVSLINN